MPWIFPCHRRRGDVRSQRRGAVFPNIAPDHPARGTLASVGYAATVNPEGVLAYTARPIWTPPGRGCAWA